MLRCQEMSQVTPTMTLADAKRTAYRNHGTVRATVLAHPSRASSTYAGVAMLSIISEHRESAARNARARGACAGNHAGDAAEGRMRDLRRLRRSRFRRAFHPDLAAQNGAPFF